MMPAKKFKVFRSKTHLQLSIMLTVLLLFLFYVAAITGYGWMYLVSMITCGIILAIWCYLNLSVILTAEGIQLKRGWICISEIKWTDIRCCGRFSLKTLGSNHAESYMYFSRKSVRYAALVSSKVLPKQTKDFIFMSVQPDVLMAVDSFWIDSKKKMVLDAPIVNHFDKKV